MELAGLLGADPAEVERRLGTPDAERRGGGERWMVYRRPGLTLRIRCADDVPPGASTTPRGPGAGGPGREAGPGRGAGARVASWIASLERARPSLREAVEPLGLWPACGPDVPAAEVAGPMARRELAGPGGGPVHSLTATLGPGGFVRVAAFDEPPEWS